MTQSIESNLRAMARNYANGHAWDRLDGEAVTGAADELERLRAVVDQQMKLIVSLRAELTESYRVDGSQPLAPASSTDERAAFEAHLKHKGCEWMTQRLPHAPDTYVHATAQGLWEGWQARAALERKPIPPSTSADEIALQCASDIMQVIESPWTWRNGCQLKANIQCLVISAIMDALPERLPPVGGDLLPLIGSKVLIHLAREDAWVEHTVAGYYAWPNLRDDPNVHRVVVRVRDSQGYLNARSLKDIRYPGADS